MKENIDYQEDLAILVRRLNQFYGHDCGVHLMAPLCTYCVTRGIDVFKLCRFADPILLTKHERKAWRNLMAWVRRRGYDHRAMKVEKTFTKYYHMQNSEL